MHIDSFRVFALIYIAFTQRERRFTSRDGRAMKIGRAGSSDRRRLAAAPEITFSHFARAARSYYPLALIAFAAHQITGLQVPVSLSAPARLLYRPRPARTGGCLERHMQQRSTVNALHVDATPPPQRVGRTSPGLERAGTAHSIYTALFHHKM